MKVNQFTTGMSAQSNFLDSRGRQTGENTLTVKQAYEEQKIYKNDVKLAVNNINNFLEPVVTNLKFVFHEDLKDYYVTIVDPITNEVVKEIPPKKILDMYVAMAEYIGLLVDEKA